MILPYFNSNQFDALMANVDLLMLGVHPTVWLESWTHPFLTEVLYIFYFFYFPMPLIIIGWMYKNGKVEDIERSFFIYCICYYGAYILYFLIPVQGPRFFMSALQSVSLDGYFLAEPIRELINVLEPNKLDAFPSLHAAILIVTMFITFRHNKTMFYYFIPVSVGITVSLVYLRYHYVIDVLAGFIWGGLSWTLADKIYKKNNHNFNFHFGNPRL
jgi:membrane-associated phospholipid phosphatase